MCGKEALLIASLAVVMMLGTSPAWSQSECEKRCALNYNNTRYPNDLRICSESPDPGRCIKETMDNVKEYCRIGCAAGFKGEDNTSPNLLLCNGGTGLTEDLAAELGRRLRALAP